MELRPDPNYEGGLVARADIGEGFVVRTKMNQGAGQATHRPETVYLRGVIVAEMVVNGENPEAIQEKIVKKIAQNESQTRRTLTLIDGVVALVPVYNEKIGKEELLKARDNELVEEPTAAVRGLNRGVGPDLGRRRATDETESLVT